MTAEALFDLSSIHEAGYSIIDIVAIGVLAIALLIGLIKGFGKGTVKTIASYCGLALAYFAGSPTANGIINLTGVSNNFIFDLYFQNLPTTDAFTQSMSSMSALEKTDAMSRAMSELKIPTFFQGFFTNRAMVLDSTVGEALASSFTFFTITAFSFLILYLLAYILVRVILGKISSAVFGEDGKNALGRIAGMIKHVVKGAILLIGVILVLVFIDQMMIKAGNTALNDWIVEDLRLTDGDSISLGRILYNTASSLLNWINLR